MCSWLVPGLGEIYLGERTRGIVLAAPFAFLWITGNFVLSSPLWVVSSALALWVASQIQLRRLLDIGWNPLLPSLGDLFGGRRR